MSFVADFSVSPEHRETGALRQEVRSKLSAQALSKRDLEGLVLVIDELVNNAIDHGGEYRGGDDRLVVRVRVRSEDLLVGFVDPSVPARTVVEIRHALIADADDLPALELERGRGLFLISDTLERVHVHLGPHGRGMILFGRIARQS